MDFSFEENENHILKDALRWLDIYSAGKSLISCKASFERNRFSERSVEIFPLEIPYGHRYLRRDCPQNS